MILRPSYPHHTSPTTQPTEYGVHNPAYLAHPPYPHHNTASIRERTLHPLPATSTLPHLQQRRTAPPQNPITPPAKPTNQINTKPQAHTTSQLKPQPPPLPKSIKYTHLPIPSYPFPLPIPSSSSSTANTELGRTTHGPPCAFGPQSSVFDLPTEHKNPD